MTKQWFGSGPGPEKLPLPFPKEKYKGYLKKIGVASTKDLIRFLDIEKLFLLTRKDYLVGELSIDEFSMVSGELYDHITQGIDKGLFSKEHEELLTQRLSEVITLKDAIANAASLSGSTRHPNNIGFIIDYTSKRKLNN